MRLTEVNAGNNLGVSALHFAVLSGTLEVVEAFVDLGADIDAVRTNGESALDLARQNQSGEGKRIAEFLLRRMRRNE